MKHIKRITIKYAKTINRAGSWNNNKQWFEFVDHANINIDDADEIIYHEIIGHAYWQWAKKWRNVEWTKFNEIANNMPPVNDYVAKYVDDKRDGRTDTIYENEDVIFDVIRFNSKTFVFFLDDLCNFFYNGSDDMLHMTTSI